MRHTELFRSHVLLRNPGDHCRGQHESLLSVSGGMERLQMVLTIDHSLHRHVRADVARAQTASTARQPSVQSEQDGITLQTQSQRLFPS